MTAVLIALGGAAIALLTQRWCWMFAFWLGTWTLGLTTLAVLFIFKSRLPRRLYPGTGLWDYLDAHFPLLYIGDGKGDDIMAEEYVR